MLDWLLGLGGSPKIRPKHLQDIVEQLLSQQRPGSGEQPFPLNERELKRLCGAAK